MTLAFGCASVVGELEAQAMARLVPQTPPRIGVVGTGVAGLTAASELRRRWPAIPLTVYAKTLDLRQTTSWAAGGQFEPSGIWREYQDPVRKELFASCLRGSRDRIAALTRAGLASAHGIAARDNFTLDHETRSLEDFTPTDVVAPYRSGPLPFERLHVVGRHYRTWLVNPRILLPRLVADLRAAGVAFEERTLAGRADLARLPANVVINCTGLGAREVVADTALVPQRGHLVLLKKTSEAQDWFFSGGCGFGVISYVFCRQDDIVVGGSLFAGRDATTVTPADEPVFAQILENGRQLFAGRPEACRL
jgi:D-amino-acid oxidase